MTRTEKKLRRRLARGGWPDYYDLYNESDVEGVSISLCTGGNLCADRCGTLLVLEDADEPRDRGGASGGLREPDLRPLFGEPPHTPCMKSVSKTITTMCGHDIGVVLDE